MRKTIHETRYDKMLRNIEEEISDEFTKEELVVIEDQLFDDIDTLLSKYFDREITNYN